MSSHIYVSDDNQHIIEPTEIKPNPKTWPLLTTRQKRGSINKVSSFLLGNEKKRKKKEKNLSVAAAIGEQLSNAEFFV